MLGENCLKPFFQYSVRFWKSYFLKPLWSKISNCRHVTFPFLSYYPVSFNQVRSALVWAYWLISNPSANSLVSIETFLCFAQPFREGVGVSERTGTCSDIGSVTRYYLRVHRLLHLSAWVSPKSVIFLRFALIFRTLFCTLCSCSF